MCMQSVPVHVNDVRADPIQKAGVVRDDQCGNRRGAIRPQALHVLCEPGDVLHVEVASGLVQEQQICALEHRAGEAELHPPAPAQCPDGPPQAPLALEAPLSQRTGHFVLGQLQGPYHLIRQEVLHRRHLALWVFLADPVLHERGDHLLHWREVAHAPLVDRAQDGALAAVVAPDEPVDAAAFQAQVGAHEQRGRATGEREGAVAQQARSLPRSAGRRRRGLAGALADHAGEPAANLADLIDHLPRAAHAQQRLQQGHQLLRPDLLLRQAGVPEADAQRHNVLQNDSANGRRAWRQNVAPRALPRLSVVECAVEDRAQLLAHGAHDVEVRGLRQRGARSARHRAHVRVRGVLADALQLGEQLRGEGRHVGHGGDEAAHVLGDDAGLALRPQVTGAQCLDEHREHHGKRGCLDLLHEHDLCQLPHACRHVLGALGAGEDVAVEGLQVSAAAEPEQHLHGVNRGSSDFADGVDKQGHNRRE
mmetsp:Transcript_67886/g.192676  ORF Transcript_67886/g.192676 Transcript_67886/m.192676 type:complete len:479 (+) Transcript_67886:722-2158(+)